MQRLKHIDLHLDQELWEELQSMESPFHMEHFRLRFIEVSGRVLSPSSGYYRVPGWSDGSLLE